MKIWIDLDHTPHVPLFRPIIEELQKRDIEVLVTARDFAQTVALLEMWNIPHVKIGRHGGSSKVGKVLNLFERSSQLVSKVRKQRIDLAVSHGSRTMLVACKFLGIPAVTMMDYEYTEVGIFNLLSKYLLVPKYIPEERLIPNGFNLKKLKRYPGFKEELYLPYFTPDSSFRQLIGVPEGKTLVTIRPSAMYANYHDPLSEQILLKVIERTLGTPNAWPLIVSRIDKDKEFIRERFGDKVNFLEQAVDGLQLIWNSDVFISGGGTMNREAGLLSGGCREKGMGVETCESRGVSESGSDRVAECGSMGDGHKKHDKTPKEHDLNVPEGRLNDLNAAHRAAPAVYSIFTGRKPYLDEYLAEQGKLVFVDSLEKVDLIDIKSRDRMSEFRCQNPNLVKQVVEQLLGLAED